MALRDREASLLEREAAVARQSLEHLLREATLRAREETNRRVTELQPRTSGEWAASARYTEDMDHYGEVLIAAVRADLTPPRPPPRLVFERALPSSLPGLRPLTADRRDPDWVEYDSDSSSEGLTANSSAELEDDPDQWGGMLSPPDPSI